jgi:ribonuclease HI
LAILTYGETTTEAEAYTNSDLAKIEKWAKQNKMKFNELKSKTMLISRKRKRNREDINIYLNNRRLEQVKEMKNLGIYFDKKLNFHKHIEHITEKSRKFIYMLGKTAKLNWGLGHKALKTIYEGAIAPLMTYGAPVWEEATKKNTLLRKLQSTQRLINIKIAKAYRTISFEASCTMAGVLPIGIAIEGKTQLYKLKHPQENNQIEYDIPLPVHEWPHPAKQIIINEANENTSCALEVFTDGSKDNKSVGAGVAMYQHNQLIKEGKYRLSNYCSNNQAEQIAILKALDLILEMKTATYKEIVIYSDSKTSLDCIKKQTNHGFIIEQIRNKIRQLTEQQWKIYFKWVKAHIGIEGNEKADKLAKEAAKDENINRQVAYSRVPISTLANDIKNKGHEQWQLLWDTTTKGVACRSFFPSLDKRLQMRIPVTPEFTALVTGHIKTKTYLHRFKLADDPTCPCKQAPQTPDHIIYECDIIEAQRSYLINQIILSGGIWPPTKNELISNYLKAFTKFVNLIDFEKLS